MGMDLEPVAPTAEAPKRQDGTPKWGRYNWSGWSWLMDLLEKWGVDTREFSGMNDGEVISEETCRQVADAIEKHLPELDGEAQAVLKEDIILWRTCGGYRQF